MPTLTETAHARSNPITINVLIRGIINIIAFTLPFQVFAIPLPGKALEAAHIFGLILIFLLTCFVFWTGRFRRFEGPEKGLFLCFGLACLSLVVGQMVYGWPEQLTKGVQQLVGLVLMIMIFLAVRRYCDTPRTFQNTVKWLWRGTLMLALFGIWQFIAYNFLHTDFLANWEWVTPLNPSIGGWRYQGFMGPIQRVNSFAPEAAHYCQFLLISIGLVISRLYPPPLAKKSPWKSLLPSFPVAATYLFAYLISFSIVGILGLVIAVIFYVFLVQLLSFRRALFFLLLGIAGLGGLVLISQGRLANKMATISTIFHGDNKGGIDITEHLSALALASNLQLAITSFKKEPLLGWGIGGNSIAFERYAPAWALNNKLLAHLNTEDACSLALRLISEMGILGLIVFSGFFFLLIRRSWRAVRGGMGDEVSPVLPICAGILVGATAEIIIYMVRMGNYNAIAFWFLLAMASVIPEVLENSIKS